MRKFVEFNLVEAVPQHNTMSDQDGYKVVGDTGRTRWEPKEIFEENFKSIEDGMGFGLAIYMLKCGYKLARKGWNGKGMWLKLVEADEYSTVGVGVKDTLPWIGMKTADNKFVPWLASQTDMLAEDWEIVE